MSHATPQMRDLAECLMACEARGNQSSETRAAAAFPVCEKMRPHLATLMGTTGFRALLLRSLALATAEIPWLRVVQVQTDGSLAGLKALEARADSAESAEGSIVLVAQLLGLLVAFIGENLTLRMVRDIWPKLSLHDLDFGKEIKNEKAK